MTSTRTHKARTARRLGELSLAAPHVATERLTRLWLAGPTLSERDRKEFTGMIVEKQIAFAQSWMAMFAEAARVQQSLWLSWLGNAPSLWQMSPASMWMRLFTQQQNAVHRIAGKGLAPVHRKATANSRRLARSR